MTTLNSAPAHSAQPRQPVHTADPQQPQVKKESWLWSIVPHPFLVLWALLVTVPLLWSVIQAFKSDDEILHSPLSLPKEWHFDAFGRAWTKGHLGDYFLNTLIVLVPGVLLTMLLGAMVAYVLARYEFWGNRIVYWLFVIGLFMPIFLGLVPLYLTVKNLGDSLGMADVIGLNTYGGLILVYIGYSLPFTVFFLHAFFRTLPTSIGEAAMVDGASHTRLFFQVMMPMAKPGLISIGLFNVIGQWNQFIFPTLLMQKQSGFDSEKFVLTQGLLYLANNSKYETDWARLFAGMTLAMLPILAVYLIFNRQIQAGLTSATTK